MGSAYYYYLRKIHGPKPMNYVRPEVRHIYLFIIIIAIIYFLQLFIAINSVYLLYCNTLHLIAK